MISFCIVTFSTALPFRKTDVVSKFRANAKAGLIAGGVVIWMVLIGWVMRSWGDYEHTPAIQGEAPRVWPRESMLTSDSENGTLIVFVHPNCPCSRGALQTIAEAFRTSQNFVPRIYAVLSASGLDVTLPSENLALARRIPSAEIRFDGDMSEARRFGATASGTVYFFDGSNQLRFSGGISAGRGDSFDNGFAVALFEAIRQPEFTLVAAPVFGCPLSDQRSLRTQ